jgi:hypothetical protein
MRQADQIPGWLGNLLETFVREVMASGSTVGVYAHGSLGFGDFRDGRSDVDLVVLQRGDLSPPDEAAARNRHKRLIAHDRRARALHCAYVPQDTIADLVREHPVWAHARWSRRPVSAFARAELLSVGLVLVGPPIRTVIPELDPAALIQTAKQEMRGYWLPKTRSRQLWLRTLWVDIGLTSAVRALAAVDTGEVISKTEAIARMPGLGVPSWLADDLAARRVGLKRWRTPWRTVRRAAAARAQLRRLIALLPD